MLERAAKRRLAKDLDRGDRKAESAGNAGNDAIRLIIRLLIPGALLMASCTSPHAATDGQGVTPALVGSVEPGFLYRIQATTTDVAYAASVSFIEPTGGPGGTPKTVATTVTSDDGRFNLTLPKFNPTPGAIYFLEAFKGLGSNMAGQDAARLRTIVQWKSGSWLSLTSATPGDGIVVGLSTTALSVAAQLNTAGGKRVEYTSLIGKLTPGTTPNPYVPVTNLPNSDYLEAFGVVDAALGGHLDPVASITKVDGVFVLNRPGSTGIGLSPGLGVDVGDTVTISGLTFSATPTNNQVFFTGATGAPAQVLSVSADRSSIQVRVPQTATRGPVTVNVLGGERNGVYDYPIFGTLNVIVTGIPGGSSKIDVTLKPFSGASKTESVATPASTASVSFKGLVPGKGWTVTAEARNASNAAWAQSTQIDGPFDSLTLSNRPIAGPYEVLSGRQSWTAGLRVAPVVGKTLDDL